MSENTPENGKSMNPSRRLFLGGAAAAGAVLVQGCGTVQILPRHILGGPRYVSPNEKMNVGVIGCGGKGLEDMKNVMKTENIIALCDVDESRAAEGFALHPNAKHYTDYREMLDKEKTLDAVIVSTPDHMHAPASCAAMRRGLHVFCQKPLTHDVFEAREMRRLARKYGVITQMGNQGTSEDGLRRAVELVQAGAIGPVREAHVWTNRPIWPQGMTAPLEEMVAPNSMHWENWIGAAPMRPFNIGYAPFKWRGWLDFGTGALGDMACHTANMAFMALKLEYPTSVEAQTSGTNDQTYPAWSIIKFEFPARGEMPPCAFTWYDGGKLPPKELTDRIIDEIKQRRFNGYKLPKEFVEGKEISNSGSILVGDKGILFSPNDYGAKFALLPFKDFEGYEGPAETLPRSPGHYKEWVAGCKGGQMPMSNFDYAGLLTETILLGNVAMRVGQKLEWNGEKMRFTNDGNANAFLRREYRKGYAL